MPVLIDSIVPLEKIWKSFPKFAGVVKRCKCAGRAATAVDDNGPINFLSSLTVTSDFSESSLHWVFIFATFCCGRVSVIFWESTNTPRNSKVDVGSTNGCIL